MRRSRPLASVLVFTLVSDLVQFVSGRLRIANRASRREPVPAKTARVLSRAPSFKLGYVVGEISIDDPRGKDQPDDQCDFCRFRTEAEVTPEASLVGVVDKAYLQERPASRQNR